MKILKLILLLIVLIPSLAQAKPQVYFDYKIYFTPDHQPYIETLMMFHCGTLKFIGNDDGNLTSQGIYVSNLLCNQRTPWLSIFQNRVNNACLGILLRGICQ